MTLGLYAHVSAPHVSHLPSRCGRRYATALPALRLYPPLTRDNRRRAAASLVSHLVFGALLRD